ncbi:MAG: hypothetical protein IPL71_20445 [Anaerolineales bacterium]|uniref:hypothetical protein n=1 Tax=Candidatus Villigracilis proximus TaxID=3140683 RepID=UPI0031367BCF|nr:hypothetical protein [Anaerolineales bacterium]
MGILAGFFLVLTGFDVLKIDKVTVTPGTKTWMTGLILGVIGFFFLTFDSGVFSGGNPSTQSAIPTTGPLAIYDDFENLSYEGVINTDKWFSKFSSTCIVAQRSGGLFISNKEDSQGADCIAVVNQPRLVSFDQIGVMQADIQFKKGVQNGAVNQGLTILKSSNPNFYAYCGLGAAPDSISLEFVGDYNRQNLFSQGIPAEFDRTYTLRLAFDPKTSTFTCTANGQLLGSFSVADIDELKSATYERQLSGWRSENSFAEAVIDNFSFGTP